jgi:hypothetical protein
MGFFKKEPTMVESQSRKEPTMVEKIPCYRQNTTKQRAYSSAWLECFNAQITLRLMVQR